MRTFIAIEAPSEVKTALASLQDDQQQVGADVAWTDLDSFHLTLKFLGEIDKKLISEIEKSCLEICGKSRTFSLTINGTRVFPNIRHPRVLWVGLDGEINSLELLQEQIDEKLSLIGFEPEEKDFRPHLTIGRIKSNRNVRELIARSDLYSLPSLSFTVREIVLMKSDLHAAGAVYSELARIKMNG